MSRQRASLNGDRRTLPGLDNTLLVLLAFVVTALALALGRSGALGGVAAWMLWTPVWVLWWAALAAFWWECANRLTAVTVIFVGAAAALWTLACWALVHPTVII
jgi:hypothetical protein